MLTDLKRKFRFDRNFELILRSRQEWVRGEVPIERDLELDLDCWIED